MWTKNLKNDMESPHDEWEFRYCARLKTTAVNSWLLPRLPWESWLHKDGKIPGVYEAASIPPSILIKLKACRDQCLIFLGKGLHTLKSVVQCVSTNRLALLKLDRTFVLDLALVGELETSLVKEVEADVLATFPTEPGRQTPLEVTVSQTYGHETGARA